MAAENESAIPSQPTRLLSCLVAATANGPDNNAIMLCEVIGNEIQSISLRVAADMMSISPSEGAEGAA